jgi:hypothetical protein
VLLSLLVCSKDFLLRAHDNSLNATGTTQRRCRTFFLTQKSVAENETGVLDMTFPSLLLLSWCLAAAIAAAGPARAAPIPPDSVILFTMTQLNVFARQAGTTTVTIYDLGNNNAVFDTITLTAEGEMYERTSGVPNYIAVSSTKEVTLFTGRALATSNDWSGVFIADDSNEKVGRVLRGLMETHLFVFVPRGPGDNSTTSVNVTVDPAGGAPTTYRWSDADRNVGYSGADVDVFYLNSQQHKSTTVRCSRNCMVQTGSPSLLTTFGWTVVPGSFFCGDDGRNIGSDFVFLGHRDFVVHPVDDSVEVTIQDVASGYSMTVTLTNKQIWTNRALQLTTAASSGGFSQHPTTGFAGTFPGAYTSHGKVLRVTSNKRVQVRVGPNIGAGSLFTLDMTSGESTDEEFFEAFGLLQQWGFAVLQNENVPIQVLPMTRGTISTLVDRPAFTIPAGSFGGTGPFFFSGSQITAAPFSQVAFEGEIVRFQSTRPFVLFYGDYYNGWFGACCSASFVPVIPSNQLLEPVSLVDPRFVSLAVELERAVCCQRLPVL